MSDTLYVLAASYDELDDAVAAYDAIEAAYRHVGTNHDFDATVIARGDDGEVEIVRRHDEPARHGTQVGLGWGVAAGAVAVLFPGVGIFGALAVGGGTGAALGAVARHASRSMTREDLMTLGQVLDRGDAGLVVVFASEMAGRVTPAVSGATSTVRTTTSVSVDQLASEIRDAEAAAR
jgi:uncharacterized membrane protein